MQESLTLARRMSAFFPSKTPTNLEHNPFSYTETSR